ncbi:SURF1 family cytochrome oxidase biogenesis protein [Pseudonocardia nigra]|uniref:SURF1 family cytochrome oxidase biogenesis protein n=1 Tax=Pseudonocardia nigra TaxID=1921578 RepID=UPI001C5E39FA|nr:SURF1 family cytochrome oxidase biogenesis protein [Pseudonocardia nigra]
MRFLLRPGWLALIAVVVGFVVACYTLLAPWQFGREAQRDAQQQAIDASYANPPVPLGELVAPGTGVGPDVVWRQVTVTGEYLPDAEALVRLRVMEGKPAFEVLTPFRTDDGRLVTVNRGYVTSPSGSIVPEFAAPPEGRVTLTARLRTNETDPQARAPFEADGHRQLYAADSRTLAAATGLALEPGYLQLNPDQPGVLTPLPVEPNTGGAPFTNFSYALQWLTFGAIALFALAYFVRLELLQRRKGTDRKAEKAALRRALAGEDGEPGAPDETPAGETPLADRYGRR